MTEILQALLTPLLAVVATYIAYQQYRIRKDERGLVLYDRRLAVFKNAIGVLDRVRLGDDLSSSEVIAWGASVAEAKFLFGEEVEAVLDSLFSALHDYSSYGEEANRQEKKEKKFLTVPALKRSEAAIWVDSHEYPLMEAFSPYLRPAGSPTRRKSRLSLKQARALLHPAPDYARYDPEGLDDTDIPF